MFPRRLFQMRVLSLQGTARLQARRQAKANGGRPSCCRGEPGKGGVRESKNIVMINLNYFLLKECPFYVELRKLTF